MSYLLSPGRPIRRVSLALALAVATPGHAQYSGGAVVQPLPAADDPAEKLAAALRTLAVSPRDLAALIEAGRDALTLGDPNAAVGFFGRANEISPRDGRIKAGLGAALVQLEKPREALRYFEEATALGVPEADLAEDRGLAYDLVGDPARAQRDYQIVLAAHPDDDAARRRLALSQGISGNRAAAISTLDPLIRKRDIAAWRAQTFVLAMTGDTKGANDITRIMLPQQQAMLQPFLERLATLSPGDKARAVHFGEMPAAGRSYSGAQLASIGTPATYAPAPTPAPARPAATVSRPVPAPMPARVAAAPTPAVAPAAAPPQVTSVAPPATQMASTAPIKPAQPRFVSPEGVPLRRIEHTPQEMMSLGLPRYDYVPLTDAAPSRPASVRQATQAPPPIAATPPAPSGLVAAAEPPVANVPAEPVAPASPVEAAPLPSVATPTAVASGAIALPLGASGSAGHFDVPHETAEQHPIPRVEQQSARAPAAVKPHAEAIAAAELAPAEPALAVNPTVAAARRVHGGTETAAVDRPARSVAPRGAVAPDEASDGTPRSGASEKIHRAADRTRSEDDAATERGARRARAAVRDGGRVEAQDERQETRSDRKERHGAHPGARDDNEDAGSSRRVRGKGKGDDDREPPEAKAPRKKGEADKSDRSEKPDKASAGGKVYVQVAGGANREDMDKAWAGVKAKAPELMKGHTPSTTPLKATNRLLVGPFKSEDEAQAFVNKMAGKGLSGFTFKSGKGQKIDKVDTGK